MDFWFWCLFFFVLILALVEFAIIVVLSIILIREGKRAEQRSRKLRKLIFGVVDDIEKEIDDIRRYHSQMESIFKAAKK